MTLWETYLLPYHQVQTNLVKPGPCVAFRMLVEHVFTYDATLLRVELFIAIDSDVGPDAMDKIRALLDRNELNATSLHCGVFRLHPTCDPWALRDDIIKTFQRPVPHETAPSKEDLVDKARVMSLKLVQIAMIMHTLPPCPTQEGRPRRSRLPRFVDDDEIAQVMESMSQHPSDVHVLLDLIRFPIQFSWDAP